MSSKAGSEHASHCWNNIWSLGEDLKNEVIGTAETLMESGVVFSYPPTLTEGNPYSHSVTGALITDFDFLLTSYNSYINKALT
jgi:hypothetical protein